MSSACSRAAVAVTCRKAWTSSGPNRSRLGGPDVTVRDHAVGRGDAIEVGVDDLAGGHLARLQCVSRARWR
jgi:hypothetical protein